MTNLEPSNSRFLAACRLTPGTETPVWFMRQAGRYMPVYRKLREKYSLLQLCRTPELACEVTLQPLERYDLDAGIIFADILLPLAPMGVPFDFLKGEGPVIQKPVRSAEDIRALRSFAPEEGLNFVLEAIRLVCAELKGRIPLIGFCGAPFTLASYMIEGGASRNYIHTKRLMYEAPELWHALNTRIVDVLAPFLKAQVEAGAQALQVFDSWVGALSPTDYEEFVLPHSRRLLTAAHETGVPVIHFGTGTATLFGLLREAGGSVIGVDWRSNLDEAWQVIGYDRAVQGNLDPLLLMAPPEVLRGRVRDVLRRAGGRPGHIFNLGHGILPETPVESLDIVIDTVRSWEG